MSAMLYLASSAPIPARPNPHDRVLSVNEALAAGITDLPQEFLAEDFDKDLPDIILSSDREVIIDTDTGAIDDGDFDDDFAIWPLYEKLYGMWTEKPFVAEVEWFRYTDGRAAQLIDCIKALLETTDTQEIELWHTWLDDERHPAYKQTIPVQDLVVADIEEIERAEVHREPCHDYCYVITR